MTKTFTIEEKEYYDHWWGSPVLQLRSRHFPGKSRVGDRVATRIPWEFDKRENPISYRWFLGIIVNGDLDPDGVHASIWGASDPVMTRLAAMAWVEERSIPNNRGVQLLAKDIEAIKQQRKAKEIIE